LFATACNLVERRHRDRLTLAGPQRRRCACHENLWPPTVRAFFRNGEKGHLLTQIPKMK
jgi:hypothetical protein